MNITTFHFEFIIKFKFLNFEQLFKNEHKTVRMTS